MQALATQCKQTWFFNINILSISISPVWMYNSRIKKCSHIKLQIFLEMNTKTRFSIAVKNLWLYPTLPKTVQSQQNNLSAMPISSYFLTWKSWETFYNLVTTINCWWYFIFNSPSPPLTPTVAKKQFDNHLMEIKVVKYCIWFLWTKVTLFQFWV